MSAKKKSGRTGAEASRGASASPSEGANAGSSVSVSASAPSSASTASDGRALRDFRAAALVSIVLGIGLITWGVDGGHAAAVEIGVALGGFALWFAAWFELFPSGRAAIEYLHPRSFFLATWRELDAEAAAERAARTTTLAGYRGDQVVSDAPFDYRPLLALTIGAAFLSVMEYFGHTVHFVEYAEAHWPELRDSEWYELMGFAWWSAFRVLGYFVVPVLLIKLVFKERLRDHGLETRGFLDHVWIYALSYTVVLLCVVLVSRHDEHFQTYYPFYHRANRSWLDFWAWELLYAAQFFSLEFFFRGFWLRAMKPSMGSQAIFAMVVPYCMIHFGKPFLETLAAIIAGLVLGTLSMKTRSIWSGFLIHVSVAVSMDMAALLATRGLPTEWLPLP